MTILHASGPGPIHPPNVSHPRRGKTNRHNLHGNLESGRMSLGDEAKLVSGNAWCNINLCTYYFK